jgi:hypothetical protein
MNWRRWKFSALLAGTVMAGNAVAQAPAPITHTSPPGCAFPILRPISPAPSTMPSTTPTPGTTATPSTTPTTAPQAAAADQAQAGEGATNESFASGVSYTESLATPAGTGLTSATTVQTGGGRGVGPTGGFASFSTRVATAPTPLILPGLFTAINPEPARPQNRVFVGYGYYDGFQVANLAGTGLRQGFNLNVFNLGAEMAFLDNRASAYFRVPFLAATDNIAGVPLDGLGDISLGVKYALLSCNETGSVLSVGVTVATPTARDLSVTTNRYSNTLSADRSFTIGGHTYTLPNDATSTVNPTYYQPWVGGLLVRDRLFVSGYAGLVLSSDDSVASFVNTEVGLGYQLYRCESHDSWVTSITPTFSVQTLLPINHQGTPLGNLNYGGSVTVGAGGVLSDTIPQQGFSINSPYQVFLTEGVSVGIGSRSLLSVGIVLPVTGPKAYSVGAVVGFNFFF